MGTRNENEESGWPAARLSLLVVAGYHLLWLIHPGRLLMPFRSWMSAWQTPEARQLTTRSFRKGAQPEMEEAEDSRWSPVEFVICLTWCWGRHLGCLEGPDVYGGRLRFDCASGKAGVGLMMVQGCVVRCTRVYSVVSVVVSSSQEWVW